MLSPGPAGAESLQAARAALEARDYAHAYATARPLIDSPQPAEAHAACRIGAEALVELGRFGEALPLLGRLSHQPPLTPADRPWVRLLARALQGQGLALEASDWWLTLGTLDEDGWREAETRLAPLLGQSLAPAEIAYLRWKYPRSTLLCPALPEYHEALRSAGYLREAARVARQASGPCGREAPLVPRPETQEDFFTLGLLAPLNGPYARFGIALCNGADLAHREHNASAHYPLRLRIADTAGDPTACLETVARLYQEGVRVFVGEVFSLNTMLAAAFLRDRGAVLLSPAATDTSIWHFGSGIYACPVPEEDRRSELVTYAADSLGVRRLGLIGSHEAGAADERRRLRAAAQAAGLTITFEAGYAPGTTDFAVPLGRLPVGGPLPFDALACAGTVRELVALLSHCAHLGFLGPFLGGETLGEEVIGQVAREFGLTLLLPGESYLPVAPAPGIGFDVRYERLFGAAPEAFARRGWVAVRLLGRAIEAGGFCPEALQAQLERGSAASRAGGAGRCLTVPTDLARPALVLQVGAERRNPLPTPPFGIGTARPR